MKIFRLIYIASANALETKTIKIGSGSLLEGYYNIGLNLCRVISNANEGIKCEVVPTTGLLENIDLLQKGQIDFAFTLSNIVVRAYSGTGYFADSEP